MLSENSKYFGKVHQLQFFLSSAVHAGIHLFQREFSSETDIFTVDWQLNYELNNNDGMMVKKNNQFMVHSLPFINIDLCRGGQLRNQIEIRTS